MRNAWFSRHLQSDRHLDTRPDSYHHDWTRCNAVTQAIPAMSVCGSPEKTLPPLCASTHTRVSDDCVLRDRTHRIKELKHCRSNQQHHMRTSNEHTAPTSACNTARDTRNGVLQTPQLHVVLGELRENYKQYLSPLFPVTVIRSFHVPEVLFTLPRFQSAQSWAM